MRKQVLHLQLTIALSSLASSSAYCARSRENSLGLKLIIVVNRLGDAGSSSGKSAASRSPRWTRPMRVEPEQVRRNAGRTASAA